MNEQKTKRNTIVCDKCRARKQRCNGENPCAFCRRNEVICSYSHISKKRGPKRKPGDNIENNENNNNNNNNNNNVGQHGIGVSGIINEGTLHVRNERAHYVGLFREFTKYDPGDEEGIIVPASPARDMLLRIILAWSHRMRGGHKWAGQYILEAHSLSSSLYDEPSHDAVKAFSALAYYYGAGPKSSHYASIARGLSTQMKEETAHTKKIQYETFMYATLQDTGTTGKMKSDSIISHPHSFVSHGIAGCSCSRCSLIPTRLQHLLVRMIALIALKIDLYYDSVSYLNLLECDFTAQERDLLVEGCDNFEAVMNSGVHLFGGQNYVYFLPLKALKTLLLYKEGDLERGKITALQAVRYCEQPHVVYAMHCNPGALILITALTMRLGLMNEAYKMGEIIAKISYEVTLKKVMLALPSLDWNSILSSFSSSSSSSSSSSLLTNSSPPATPSPTSENSLSPNNSLSPSTSFSLHYPLPLANNSFPPSEIYLSNNNNPLSSGISTSVLSEISDSLSFSSLSSLSSLSTIDIATLEDLLSLPPTSDDLLLYN